MDLRTQTLQLLERAGAVEEKVIGHKSVYRFPNGKKWNFAGITDLKMFLRRNGMDHLLDKKKPVESDPGPEDHSHRREKKKAGTNHSQKYIAIPPAPKLELATFKDKLVDAVGIVNTSQGRELRDRYAPRFHPESQEESRVAREYLEEQERIHREQEESRKRAIEEAEREYERSLEHQPYKSGYRKPIERAPVGTVIKLDEWEVLLADRIRKYQGENAYNDFVRETLAAKRNPQPKGEAQMPKHVNFGQVNAARAIDAQIEQAKEQLQLLESGLQAKEEVIAIDKQKIDDIKKSLQTLESPAVREAMVLMHATSLAAPNRNKPERRAMEKGPRVMGDRKQRKTAVLEALAEHTEPVRLRAFIEKHGLCGAASEGALYQTFVVMAKAGEIEKVDSEEGVKWQSPRVQMTTDEIARATA